METENQIKIQIPVGHTARIENNTVVFEPKKVKFKKGDFVFTNGPQGDSILIYSGSENKVICLYFLSSGRIYFDGITSSDFIRFATNSEKQLLLDKLHEAGKNWDSEKCEIIDLRYIPEIGDCVKVQLFNGEFCVFECTEKNLESVNSRTYIYQPKQKVFIDDDSELGWELNGDGNVFTKITRKELQFEFNKLGYEYDFTTHTARQVEWNPKIGEQYYILVGSERPVALVWNNDTTDKSRWSDGFVFRTKKLAESALELLKQAKHY